MPPAVAPAAARERLRCAPRAAWDPPRGSGRRPAPVSASARPRIRVVDAFRRASSGRRGAPRFPTGSLARGPGPSLGSAPRASRVPPDDPGALTDTTTTGVDATVDVDEADDRARDGSWSFRSLENVMVGATRPLEDVARWASGDFDAVEDDDELYKMRLPGASLDDEDDDVDVGSWFFGEDVGLANRGWARRRRRRPRPTGDAAATWATDDDVETLPPLTDLDRIGVGALVAGVSSWVADRRERARAAAAAAAAPPPSTSSRSTTPRAEPPRSDATRCTSSPSRTADGPSRYFDIVRGETQRGRRW